MVRSRDSIVTIVVFFLRRIGLSKNLLGGLLAFAKIQPVSNPLYEFPLKVLC